MQNLQYRSAITVFVWLTILSYLLIIIIFVDTPIKQYAIEDYYKIIKPVGLIVTLNIFLWISFNKFGWKLSFFQGWLVSIPNLNGVWVGNYDNGQIKREVILTITQTLTNLSCKIQTSNGISTSYSAYIQYEPENNKKKLIITYNYESNDRENRDHRGTYDLHINEDILTGSYWTNKPSKGKLFLSKKDI